MVTLFTSHAVALVRATRSRQVGAYDGKPAARDFMQCV